MKKELAVQFAKKTSYAIVTCLAIFSSLNIALGFLNPRLDATAIWLDIGSRPLTPGWLLLVIFSASVLAYRHLAEHWQRFARFFVGVVGVFCLWDVVSYYLLVFNGTISTSLPLPLSLPLAVSLFVWAARPPSARKLTALRCTFAAAAVLAAGGIILLVQMLAFGNTDYRRPADAIVVFGAGVTPQGQASLALYDRTVTGCRLWQEGLAPVLIFSGGRNPAVPRSEPEVMHEIAQEMGVPDDAVILDLDGINTAATVANVAALAAEHGWSRVLMVSHDYHLSRISLTCSRAGLSAVTVPAEETRRLILRPYYIQRELVAWVYYYLCGGAQK